MSSLFSRQNEEKNGIKDEAKADSGENSNTFFAAPLMRNLFEHFMNKNLLSVSEKCSQETESAQSSDGNHEPPKAISGVTMKVEDTLGEQIGEDKYVKMEEGDIGRILTSTRTNEQGTTENPASHSPAMYNAGDSQAERSCSIIKPPSSYNEGQERHQNSDDCAITKSPLSKNEEQRKHILPPDSSTSTEEADGKTGHERPSEKKRKRKHSRKNSKSLRHSKRSKLSDPQYKDGEDKVNASRIRDKIPKDLSVRHESTQKKELRGGKKRFKSKRFKKIMLSELAPHQVRVTSWMVKREREPLRQACGGIIAYEMGLGKTVMSLACIAAHRLRKKERKISCQATLVIVPSSTLATQWLGEAEVREETGEREVENQKIHTNYTTETLACRCELACGYI